MFWGTWRDTSDRNLWWHGWHGKRGACQCNGRQGFFRLVWAGLHKERNACWGWRNKTTVAESFGRNKWQTDQVWKRKPDSAWNNNKCGFIKQWWTIYALSCWRHQNLYIIGYVATTDRRSYFYRQRDKTWKYDTGEC